MLSLLPSLSLALLPSAFCGCILARMNDRGHWVCRLDSQGTVSYLIYIKSQWDGDNIGGACTQRQQDAI